MNQGADQMYNRWTGIDDFDCLPFAPDTCETQMTVEELLAARKWRTIPNCLGRYVLVKPEPSLSPQQLAQVNYAPAEFCVEAAKDVVVVLALEGGGLISYRRADGSYCHTLSTESGFKRKLAQLGIMLT
jgi:hypothetical protein